MRSVRSSRRRETAYVHGTGTCPLCGSADVFFAAGDPVWVCWSCRAGGSVVIARVEHVAGAMHVYLQPSALNPTSAAWKLPRCDGYAPPEAVHG